jgi:hypothetical protein
MYLTVPKTGRSGPGPRERKVGCRGEMRSSVHVVAIRSHRWPSMILMRMSGTGLEGRLFRRAAIGLAISHPLGPARRGDGHQTPTLDRLRVLPGFDQFTKLQDELERRPPSIRRRRRLGRRQRTLTYVKNGQSRRFDPRRRRMSRRARRRRRQGQPPDLRRRPMPARARGPRPPARAPRRPNRAKPTIGTGTYSALPMAQAKSRSRPTAVRPPGSERRCELGLRRGVGSTTAIWWSPDNRRSGSIDS